jgi:hypothetical protein
LSGLDVESAVAMAPPRSRIVLIPAVLALIAIALTGPAWAHIVAPSVPPSQGASGSSLAHPREHGEHAPGGTPAGTTTPAASRLALMLSLAALFGTALAWRQQWRVLVFSLVLGLGLFAYETGLHSVHHGLDGNSQRCPVAVASLHLAALTVDAPSTVAVSPLVTPATIQVTTAVLSHLVRPNLGRAPPAAT